MRFDVMRHVGVRATRVFHDEDGGWLKFTAADGGGDGDVIVFDEYKREWKIF